MSDQGDKIIHLAREMLRSRPQTIHDSAAARQEHNANYLAIKAAAIAALVASFGSVSLTHMIEESRRPMNHYERVEIEALVFYATKQGVVNEKTLQQEITTLLSVPSLKDMTVFDYRRVRDYLRDRIHAKTAKPD